MHVFKSLRTFYFIFITWKVFSFIDLTFTIPKSMILGPVNILYSISQVNSILLYFDSKYDCGSVPNLILTF